MDDRDSILVGLVKQHHHIYDKNSSLFKDRNTVDKSWATIAACMKTTAEDCQRRWCVLRNRYAKERREMEKPDGLRKSWPLMDHMSFLEFHVKRRRSYRQCELNGLIMENTALNDSNPMRQPLKLEEIIIDDYDDLIDEPETKHIHSDHSNSSSCFTNDEITISASAKPELAPQIPKIVSCEANYYEDKLTKENNSADPTTLIESADTEMNSNNNESNMHFCLSLRDSLQKIPKKYLTKAKIEILQIIDKYENTV